MISDKNKLAKGLMLATVLSLVAPPVQASTFKPHVGFTVGYDYLKAQGGEANKNGYDIGAKLLGSWKFDGLYIDPAIGYQYEALHAQDISMQTSSPFAELAIRVRLSQQWSLGPISQVHYGNDQSRSELPDNNRWMWNAGAQLMYDASTKPNPIRLEAAVVKSLKGLDNRDLYSFKVGIQIPLGSEEPRREIERTREVVVVKNAPRPRVIERLPVVVVPGVVKKDTYIRQDNSDLKLTLNSSVIGFKVNSYELDARSEEKLMALGKYLVDNNVQMDKLQVSGHTDRRGTREYNLKLSERRAESVRDVLVRAGVQTKIVTYGYGFSRPIDDRDTTEAMDKNRRTEIEFIRVIDKQNLIQEINRIMSAE